MIDIYAGKHALKTIQENGFKQELFTSFLGASGGPKWFSLYGLDKYLLGEFFKDRKQELNLIGSSAGAFRAACYAKKDPVNAIEIFAKIYSETTYSKYASPEEVTGKAKDLLNILFDEKSIQEVINNPIFKAHFIVAKAKGLNVVDNRLIQGMDMLASHLTNRVGRKWLGMLYDRFVFQPENSSLEFDDAYHFKTQKIALTQNNFTDALLASGSIPMVMQGVKNIVDSPRGMYWDGGIVDYHFDIKIKNAGLTLYPHFNSQPKAGWFDKKLARNVSEKNYDNTVLICPSEKFIASLPYHKIPDRTDFTKIEASERLKYWKTVLQQTQQLGDSFGQFIQQENFDQIKLFN